MIDLQGYDRTGSLSGSELHHMQSLVAWAQQGNKGWHKEARPALQRLLRPLEDVLDHLGAVNTVKRKYTIRTTVVCLLIRAMVQHEESFWAFSQEVWLELLGTDYYAYVRVHGVTANARHQLIAIAYLFCGFQELGSLGRLAFPALARKIFGAEAFDAVIEEMKADLLSWGYSRKGNIVGLRCALAEAMLATRSLHLADLKAETLDCLYQEADAKITRRGLTILSYVLVRRAGCSKSLLEETDRLSARKASRIGASSGASRTSGENGVSGGFGPRHCNTAVASAFFIACSMPVVGLLRAATGRSLQTGPARWPPLMSLRSTEQS
jgi:hypothetical protein